MAAESSPRRPNPLRELSEQAVVEPISREGPVTRPRIAQRTGLSKATVGTVIDRLLAGGMIRASGPQHGLRGRSPIAYVVRDNAGFVVGVDIGGTNIRAAAAGSGSRTPTRCSSEPSGATPDKAALSGGGAGAPPGARG